MRTLVIVLASLVVILFGVAMYYYGKSQTLATATDPAATTTTTIDANSLSSSATVSAPNTPVMPPPPPAWEPDPFSKKLIVSEVVYEPRVLAASKVRGVLQNTSKHTVYAGIVIQIKFLDADYKALSIVERQVDNFITPGQTIMFDVKAQQPLGAGRTEVVVVSANELNSDEFWAE